MAMADENIAALRQRIAAPLLGVIPHMVTPDANAAAEYINVGLLAHEELPSSDNAGHE